MSICASRLFPRMTAIAIVLIGTVTASTLWADDPNELRDGTGLITASWESATRNITTYNPSVRPDLPEGTALTTLKVSGSVEVLDFNDLIAVSTTHATALWAFDQDGDAVLFDPNAVVRPAGNAWVLGDRPKTFGVELPLDLDQPYVASLSELAFTVDALYGQPFATIDVPIEVSEDWIELVPRYRIRITDVNQSGGFCWFTIDEEITDVHSHMGCRFDPNFSGWDETTPRSPRGGIRRVTDYDFIDNVQVVDVQGNRVSVQGFHSASHPTDSTVTGLRQYTLYNCESLDAVRVRYTIAMDPYEVPILLTLTDIPIPGL